MRLITLAFFCVVSLLAPHSVAVERQFQDLSQITSQAEAYLQQHYARPSKQTELRFSVGSIDQRLKLTQCDNPLTFHLHGNRSNAGNVTLKVGCQAPVNWSFYLPATVKLIQPALVAARNLQRGELIAEGDFSVEMRSLPASSGDVFSQPNQALGLEVKRTIAVGDVINARRVTQPVIVKRGDKVTISAKTGGIAVVTQGTALNNGKKGQQIKVRNSKSERVVSARVSARGQVEIIL